MNRSEPSDRTRTLIAAGLILLAAASRLVPHAWNVSPLTALALFGGAALSRRWAVGIPLGAVILSDLALGLHDTIAFTWSAFALVGGLGWWVRHRATPGRIAAGSLLGSVVFFVVSNFGVWLVGHGSTMYPKTLEGLWSCYVAALPFFRNTVVGDLAYTAGIFGTYALTAGPLPRVARAPVAATPRA